ncbi:hypothetical protein [Ornithinimicrobium sp. W1665]|uniref:hypothetical protein n=1 Tax=Ornithinimicrobium sp. W1665 TaxID=3416666 RepID=UPI003CF5D1C9
MSFHDLPQDWPTRSLADPDLAVDVLDLVVTDRDRMPGGLSFLLCRGDGRLSQPVFVGSIPHAAAMRETVSSTVLTAVTLPGVGGLVVGIVKPWGGVDDSDRALHEHILQMCRQADLPLLGTCVVTGTGIYHLPVAVDLPAAPGRGQDEGGRTGRDRAQGAA